MNDLEMAAKFREAAAFLRSRGWGHGSNGWYWEKGEAVCLEGALLAVCKVPQFMKNALADNSLPLRRVIGERVGYNPLMLWAWNDARWHENKGNPAKVIAVLEGLAHDLELRHQIASGGAAVDGGKEPTAESLAPSPAASSQEAILPTLKEAVPVA